MAERVAVIDGGGRGHAIALAYLEDPRVEVVHAIPGNDFMGALNSKIITHPELTTKDSHQIGELCLKESITLADVAQDDAVAAGVASGLRRRRIPTIGPSEAAGKVEWSKIYTRELADRLGINQPQWVAFDNLEGGFDYINECEGVEVFVKADGLALGKGALPARNSEEAKTAISRMAEFGSAGRQYIIEEWLTGDDGSPGEEFSAFAICDGKNFQMLGYAQDHKRVFDGDEGENTGGMGCYNNPSIITPEVDEEVQKMFGSVFRELTLMHTPYVGVLYAGMMNVAREGRQVPHLIEFNSRWGDPEAEVLLPLRSSLLDLSIAAANGELNDFQIDTGTTTRVAIAVASKGYPGNYDSVKGKRILGIEEAWGLDGVRIYGAGIKVEEVGRGSEFRANGGRLLYVVGEGENIVEARQRAYAGVSSIYIEGNNGHYRKDIGMRELARSYNILWT